MPYVLSGPIHTKLPGLWGEGAPYTAEIIYDIASEDTKKPPVHYLSHTIKPHSISHIDAPGHIVKEGDTVDALFENQRTSFYGPATVIRLERDRWERHSEDLWLWEITREELQDRIKKVTGQDAPPDKVFLYPDKCPLTQDGFHDSRYVFVLSEEAARWLVSSPTFNALGTSWKSSDFKPGSRERPIHKILLSQAVLFEQLVLFGVPEGEYFFSGFPLNLFGATESPVTPVLFTMDELWQKT